MADNEKPKKFQEKMELNVALFIVTLAIAVSVGGLVTVVPLFYLNSTWEDRATTPDGKPKNPELSSVRPYTALELAGRDIYLREGCYTCHSQMIRPFRDEKERYGHYSLAVESKYDHPFQWGSKRTGPDLARVGGKYSDQWHEAHLLDPRSVVPESVMPRYPWFTKATVDPNCVVSSMKAMKMLGVPYTDDDISKAPAQVTGKTEMAAMISYLQVLGTMVKFEEGKDYRD